MIITLGHLYAKVMQGGTKVKLTVHVGVISSGVYSKTAWMAKPSSAAELLVGAVNALLITLLAPSPPSG